MVLEHLEEGVPLHELAKRDDDDVSNVKYLSDCIVCMERVCSSITEKQPSTTHESKR
jgi:hypothetical protein